LFFSLSTDPDHHSQFTHPRDLNHRAMGSTNHGQFGKQECRYGARCHKYVTQRTFNFRTEIMNDENGDVNIERIVNES